jgi:prepilin-type N-terminal cleavage/methylation domain-containing protein
VKGLRKRFATEAGRSSGFTLVEVLVSMMVFAIIAISVAFALTSSLTMTRDARAREVASNLAAQAIDISRSIDDVFSVVTKTTTSPVDGVTYTTTQTTGWVSSAGSDATCGTEGGPLQYKHVNVKVTWSGMRATTPPVQADTLIAPNGRINDPSMGTILVSVVGASGAGQPDVIVTAKPAAITPNGAQAVDPVPLPTDREGCSYVLKVTPGNYDITISRTGDDYVSENQLTTVKKTVGVAAGDSTSADFQFDKASTISAIFASNSAVPSLQFPSNLSASFASENSVYIAPVSVASPSKRAILKLHPFANGYSVFAGAYVAPAGTNPGCVSVDPIAWTSPNDAGVVGKRQPAVASNPGEPASVDVPMGIVVVNKVNAGKYLTAVSATADADIGDPGCAAPMTYRFTVPMTAAAYTLALPYGTWNLYTGNSAGSTSSLLKVKDLTLPPGTPGASGKDKKGNENGDKEAFTLDPRAIAP